MGHDSSVRGMGGIFVGVGIAMIALHIGMPPCKVMTVLFLVGIGLPLAIGGR